MTSTRQWLLGHRNSKEGIVTPIPEDHPARRPTLVSAGGGAAIVGNRNSKVYRLPQVCPGYDQIAAKNQVRFETEAEARVAGFRKAGNCN